MTGSAGSAAARIGVVGAGTMGAGIAQLGAAAGIPTCVHDPVPAALEGGLERAHAGLRVWVDKGRTDPAAHDLLSPAATLDDLAGCDLVVEAGPELLDVKHAIFADLARICGPDAVLASNTSSIPVSSIAAPIERPERVLGMHFFNPPPLMRLLEIVRADQSADATVDRVRATGEALGKRVIVVGDGPGFLVNRCGRPFYGEALRLVQERLATPEQVDRICRLGGGFRMGPFELMDLVGLDVGLAVAKSFAERSFGEPRWRPSVLQAQLVASGRLGRKSGRGWYSYEDGPHRPDDPARSSPPGGDGAPVSIAGDGPIADGLRDRARAAGFHAVAAGGGRPQVAVDASTDGRADAAAQLVLCAARPLGASGRPDAVGFGLVPPVDESRLVELTRLPSTAPAAAEAAESFFAALGFEREWVGDGPGLVLGRIVCQIVNEAMFAIGEGVGSADDVDAAVTLGLNYPRGAVAWGDTLGLADVLAMVDGLWNERREERYRAAPLLRDSARRGA